MHPYCNYIVRVVLFCVVAATSASAAFTVSGRKLLKDGQPFQIKGVCYNPTPIGDNGFTRSPNGDYFTSKYSALWDRDLPLLRVMGANTVRIYGWAPTADHRAFLDRCYNGGDRPIHVFVNYWIDPNTDWNNASAVQAIINQYTAIEDRLGSHPAVAGVIVGNEVNNYNGNGSKPAFWSAMNRIAGAVKGRNPNRLVSVAITDAIDQVGSFDSTMTNIDFWCMQIYRHPSFGGLFSDFAARSSRPLVISEYGFDALNHWANTPYPNNAEYPGAVVRDRWLEIDANASVCAGACVFEWTDEFFKITSGSDTAQEPGGWANSFPDGWADEEWWGLCAVKDNGSNPDVLTPRAAYYELAAIWTASPAAPAPAPAPQPVEPAPQPVQPAPQPIEPSAPIAPSVDLSFESWPVGTHHYYAFKYQPVIAGWTFQGYAGVAGNQSAFTSGNGNATDGSQVGFVQMQGQLTLQLELAAGTYELVADVANRANWGAQQTVVVAVDGRTIGSLAGGSWYTAASTSAFTVNAGTHTFTFTGQSAADATLFLDRVRVRPAAAVQAVTMDNAGFESPSVGAHTFYAFQYRPAAWGQSWVFEGNSGLAGNGSGFTAANPAAPEGQQAAFLQMSNSAISRSVDLPASGSYTLTVNAAKRGNWNADEQIVAVYLDDATYVGSFRPQSTSYQSFSLSFAAGAGTHRLTFRGTVGSDSTALLDSVSLVRAP